MTRGVESVGNEDGVLRTSIHPEHVALGARMVRFAGWEMPMLYRGIIPEHHCVRRAVGIFDVSHMGELEIRGPEAESFLDYLTPNDVSRLRVGRAQYNCFLHEGGGVLDDFVVYRLPDYFLAVVNAVNREKIWRHLKEQRAARGYEVELHDRTLELALVSVQGPRCLEVLTPLTDIPLEEARFYSWGQGEMAGVEALVSRTGYTGERGFEIYVPWEEGRTVWRRLIEGGAAAGITPVGLGARDTLRLEMRYALYGHELREDISPLEAGLGRWVKLEKGEFLGREALLEERGRGSRRGLIGMVAGKTAVPRDGAVVELGGRRVGEVTSGGFSPSLGEGVALALVETPLPPAGSEVKVEVRGRLHPARVIEGPFQQASPSQ